MQNTYSNVLALRPGWNETMSKYNITYAIFRNTPNAITEYMLRHPNWKLVYWDKPMMVLYKKTPDHEKRFSSLGYHAFNPLRFGFIF